MIVLALGAVDGGLSAPFHSELGEQAAHVVLHRLLGKPQPRGRSLGMVMTLLVAEQVRGQRELIAGLVRDPQFGPCVMLGQGGVLAEALADAVFAVVPLAREEALRMVDGLATRRLFRSTIGWK